MRSLDGVFRIKQDAAVRTPATRGWRPTANHNAMACSPLLPMHPPATSRRTCTNRHVSTTVHGTVCPCPPSNARGTLRQCDRLSHVVVFCVPRGDAKLLLCVQWKMSPPATMILPPCFMATNGGCECGAWKKRCLVVVRVHNIGGTESFTHRPARKWLMVCTAIYCE